MSQYDASDRAIFYPMSKFKVECASMAVGFQ